MFKKILAVLLFVIAGVVNAQKVTSYFDHEGNPTTQDKCASYMISKQKYSPVDTIKSFYCATNRLQTLIQVNEWGEWNGYSFAFAENGNLSLRAKFVNSVPVDTMTEFYPNGRPHFQKFMGTPNKPLDKLINYWDSSGVQLVRDGKGFCKCYFPSLQKDSYVAGKIRNGEQDSVWLVDNSDVSQDASHGNTIYTVVEESATPKGGIGAFYEFIGRNITYPVLARRLGIEGKVFLEFVVEKDGTLTGSKSNKRNRWRM
jgi:antitoxin component YwqK of YwqJK toxin-antitoxin module